MDRFFELASSGGWIIFGAFILITIIQLFYFLYFFSRTAFRQKKPPSFSFPPVSVVICAKNEYLNLEKNLQYILDQEYPDFEVVVVDDGSDDESNFLLQDMSNLHPHLRIISLRPNVNFFQGKKFPLSMGIRSAKNELLLMTDADCRPVSNQWIKNMVRHYSENKKIVLGYGGYEKLPGILNKLIRYDTLFVGLQYLGMALAGKPYMGVGRNLLYNRELFYKVKGFTSHYKVMSGDDDLFINQVATADNMAVELSPDSITISEPKTNFKDWYRQKSRHLTTGKYYKRKHKCWLGVLGFSQVFFYPLFLALFFAGVSSELIMVALGLFLLRTVCLMIIIKYASKRFNEPKLFLYSPLLDGAMTLLNVWFSISAVFFKKNKWK